MSCGYFIKKEYKVRLYCADYPDVIKEYLRQRKPYVRKKLRQSERRVIHEELEQ